MAAHIDRHSFIVGWLKLLLPLSALVLLSVLFLLARSPGEDSAVPAATLTALAQDQGVTAPRFSGVAQDGSVIEIRARGAQPQGDDTITIDMPQLSVAASDGTTLTVQAGTGSVDNAAQIARLTGLARLITSSGYVMETQGLIVALDTGTITSIGPLEVQAPYGTLTAGTVTIAVTDAGTGQQMDFTKGVRLLYTPQTGTRAQDKNE